MGKLPRTLLTAKRFWSFRSDQDTNKIAPEIVTLRELRAAAPNETLLLSGPDSKDTPETPDYGRQWIKGVLLCAWVVSGVFCVNIILTTIAAILAYAKQDAQSFVSAPIYLGNCSVSKQWATGLHFLINILSTVMLTASNYCMQCLASPSRAEVDDAHRQRGWLKIGVPNISGLLLFGKGRRRRLGSLLLLTSLPIHLLYNSAIYSALGPSEYAIAMVQANRTLETNQDYEACSRDLFEMDISNFSSPDLQELSKQDCLDKFAQDYVYGQKALVVVTSTALPGNQSLLSLGMGHGDRSYTSKNRSPFGWMCNRKSECSKADLQRDLETWSLYGYAWSTPKVNLAIPGPDGVKNVTENDLRQYLDGQDYRRLYDILQDSNPEEETLRAELDDPAPWANSSWAKDVDILGHDLSCGSAGLSGLHRVEYCLSLPTEERCHLVFSPLICIVVICCNAVKIICIFRTARDDRDNILLTAGDAIASFLTRPDLATKDAALLSLAHVKKGALGWHESYVEYCSCELCDLRKRNQPKIPTGALHTIAKPKRWMEAASRNLWLSVLFMCASLLSLTGYLLSLGVHDIHYYNSSTSIWDYDLGETSTATLITGLSFQNSNFIVFLAMILLANTPQLLVSLTYFLYNALLSHMLLASEYNDYATDRKPLRVSWPKGPLQRSTYYLSLPYRYSIPLFITSAFLHWLVSQSLFFVEIIPHDIHGSPVDSVEVVTCGYSPKAIIFAMILGGVLVGAAVVLGLRQFRSAMPLALHCSAAISAACHPGPCADGDYGHALKAVRWGEIVVDHEDRGGRPDLEQELELELERSAADSSLLGRDEGIRSAGGAGSTRYFHCSFTSGGCVEPNISRLYV